MKIYANMTLDDLKTGMIVTTRNGFEYTVLRDVACGDNYIKNAFVRGDEGWMKFNEFNSNLKSKYNSEFDIVKVEIHEHPFGFMNLSYYKNRRTIILSEPTTVKLTVSEIESRLGYKIEIVSDTNEEE